MAVSSVRSWKLPSAPARWRSSWATTAGRGSRRCRPRNSRTAGDRPGCRRSGRPARWPSGCTGSGRASSLATWFVVTRSSQSSTPGPSNVSRPMWLMSNSPTRCADRLVLLDDRRVLHGHRPAAELDDPAAVGLVPVVERGLEQGRFGHGAIPPIAPAGRVVTGGYSSRAHRSGQQRRTGPRRHGPGHRPAGARQTLTSPSRLHEARDDPSGAKAIPLTWALCPLRTRSSWLVRASQSRITPDVPQVARELPSGANARFSNLSLAPRIVLRTSRLAGSRIVTTPVSSAVAMVPPSGANARATRGVEFRCDCKQDGAGCRVPEPNRLVVAHRGQGPPVGREGKRANRVGVARELSNAARPADVPHANGPVPPLQPFLAPCRGERPAIGSERDGPDEVLVALERMQEAPGRRVPEPDVVSHREVAGREDPTIRRERQRGHRPDPAIPAANERPGGRIPELDRLGLVGVVAAGREDLAVGRIGRGPGLVLVAGGRGRIGRRIEVPDQWRSVTAQDQRATGAREAVQVTRTIRVGQHAEAMTGRGIPDGRRLTAAGVAPGGRRHPAAIGGEDGNVGISPTLEAVGSDHEVRSACAGPTVHQTRLRPRPPARCRRDSVGRRRSGVPKLRRARSTPLTRSSTTTGSPLMAAARYRPSAEIAGSEAPAKSPGARLRTAPVNASRTLRRASLARHEEIRPRQESRRVEPIEVSSRERRAPLGDHPRRGGFAPSRSGRR